MSDSPRFPARFDGEAFEEDCSHATTAGKRVARQARARYENEGAPVAELRACQQEGRDGTRLGGCVKVYLPPPDGPWGMVFTGDTDHAQPVLVCLAFGLRHPRRAYVPSVYRVADSRLHPPST